MDTHLLAARRLHVASLPVGAGPGGWRLLPSLVRGRTSSFVDFSSPEDPYGPEVWAGARAFFAGRGASAVLLGGRCAYARDFAVHGFAVPEGAVTRASVPRRATGHLPEEWCLAASKAPWYPTNPPAPRTRSSALSSSAPAPFALATACSPVKHQAPVRLALRAGAELTICQKMPLAKE